MNRLRLSTLILGLAGSLFGLPSAAQNALPDVMRAAAIGLEPASAERQAAAALARRQSAQRQAWLPSLQLEGNAARVRNLAEIQTPGGNFTLGEENLYDLTLSLRQPLLNLSEQRHGVRALREQEQASELHAQRQARVAAAQAAYAYLDWLSLEAQLKAVQREEQSLAQQQRRVQALVDRGRALDADALDLDVALRQLEQRRVTLRSQQQVLQRALIRLSGRPVQPQAWQVQWQGPASPSAVDASRAYGQRRDLLALQAQKRAVEASLQRERSKALPTLGAELSVLRAEGNPVLPEDDVRAGLNLRWEPFTSGRRRADIRATRAQLESLELQCQAYEQLIAQEITAASAMILQARASAQTAAAARIAARDSLKTRRARLEAGRSTLDAVLAAESRLTEQDALAQSAAFEELKAVIAYNLAMGAELLPATPALQ